MWKLQQSQVGDCGLVVGVIGHSCPSISLLRKTIFGAMITMGQHVNLSASKSAPQRKCWPEFELFLRIPLLILVSQCGLSKVNECGEVCLCVPTLTMSPTAMMFACTVARHKIWRKYSWVSFLWNLPHFVVTFHGPLSLPLDLSFEYKFGYLLSMNQNCFLLSMQSLPVILI